MDNVKIPDSIIDEFIEMFETLKENQWRIGDRINELLEVKDVEKKALIGGLAGNINISAKSLYDYSRTSAKWPQDLRVQYQNLDWTIFRNADPTNPDDLALMDQAADEGWNATRFKEQKFPSLRTPQTRRERAISILSRNKDEWPARVKVRVESIIRDLEGILKIYT